MKKIILCALLLIGSYLFFAPHEASAQCSGTVYGISIVGYNDQASPRYIFGYEITALDYYLAICYDPEIEGFLDETCTVNGEGDLDYDEDVGYADWIPAVVELYSTQYHPDTSYTSLGEHWVRHWFYGTRYYVFYTRVCIRTPAIGCEPLNENGEVIPCPTPTPMPSPTPTPPTVRVIEVGFQNDLTVTKLSTDQPITDPTWIRNGSGNSDNLVAYTVGTNPTVSAKFTITPASPRNINAVIRARRDNTVITTQNIPVTLSGNLLNIDNVAMSEAALEQRQPGAPPKVKKGQYEFKWEISFNDGQTWKSIGDSGDHRIHWIVGPPINHTILNFNARELQSGQVECIDQNIPCEWNKLYDVALKNSTEKLGGGETDTNRIIEKINKALAEKIPYQPGRQTTENNPLRILTGNDGAVCWDNALLLRGLLRSIGINPTIKFYYGGKNGYRHFFFYYPDGPPCPPNGDCRATMRLSRGDLCRRQSGECVDADPHFSYHAIVDFLNKKYDPSYGEIDKPIEMQEALDIIQEQGQPPSGRLVTGNAAQLFLYESNTFEGLGYDLGIACRHRRNPFAHAGKRLFSFDNDSVTDLAVVRPSTSEWIITNKGRLQSREKRLMA